MSWEKYDKKTRYDGKRNGLQITVQKTGRLGLTTKVVYKWLKQDSILFYFNPKTLCVGLQPCDSDDCNAYKINVRRTGQGLSTSVNAVSVFNHYGIVPKQAVVYEVEWNDKMKFVQFRLNPEFYVVDEELQS